MVDFSIEEENRQTVFVRRIVVTVVAVTFAAFTASWAARTGWEIAGRKPSQVARVVRSTDFEIPEGAQWQALPAQTGLPFVVVVSDE